MNEIETKKQNLLKFAQKLVTFEGWISSVEFVVKDDGSCYSKFSVPFKQNKDDEPEWMNCYIYSSLLADRFSTDCKKGSRVWLQGIFKETERDGKKYLNFIVKNYSLLENPKQKDGDA